MKDDLAVPQNKLRLLGNILLVVASLGLLVALMMVPVTLSLTPASIPQNDPEIQEAFDELLLPEGIGLETTVRELMEHDRAFFDANHGRFLTLTFLCAAFTLAFAAICLRLALSWRKAEPFGRPIVLGLRTLGVLLVVQFLVGWIIVFVPDSWHTDLFFWSDTYQSSVDWLVGGGPTLSSGILFLILSWVLDYGRRIKEEQNLTI